VTRLLLDTHAFFWWLAGGEQLSIVAREAIGGEQDGVFVSAASTWKSRPNTAWASFRGRAQSWAILPARSKAKASSGGDLSPPCRSGSRVDKDSPHNCTK
jgi:hypothetical protein